MVDGLTVRAWDLGGHAAARQLWTKYAAMADAIVFMLDANDPERIDEAAQVSTQAATATARARARTQSIDRAARGTHAQPDPARSVLVVTAGAARSAGQRRSGRCARGRLRQQERNEGAIRGTSRKCNCATAGLDALVTRSDAHALCARFVSCLAANQSALPLATLQSGLRLSDLTHSRLQLFQISVIAETGYIEGFRWIAAQI